MTVHLLDTNVLIALAWPQHVHHRKAHEWFHEVGRSAWATCPFTEVAFVRISSNPKIISEAVSPRAALQVLTQIVAVSGHQFWSDELSPTEAASFSSLALVGHRQVTDAYLLALAQHRRGKLATFDGGIAELIPVHKDRGRNVAIVNV